MPTDYLPPITETREQQIAGWIGQAARCHEARRPDLVRTCVREVLDLLDEAEREARDG